MKKWFAGVSAAAVAVTQMGTVFAAYSDVPAGVWYEEAVNAFTDAGYLDSTQTRFRGGDLANRAEFTKLVVELNGGILSTPPAVPSFDDVAPGAWYYGYMEEAGKEGWVKGDGNCYGTSPCAARPAANINRAEAAALIVRAFGLEATGAAPDFIDVPSGQWYTDPMQTAADSCVIQGDEGAGTARPADNMNRAEMVTMLYRVDQGLEYGVDCSMESNVEPMLTDVTATSETTVEAEFNVALDEDAAMDIDLYAISGAADIEIESIDMLDDSTVELTLAEGTSAGEEYVLTVTDMMTADGDTFSEAMDFSGYTELVQGDGILELSLSSTNPMNDTVPAGALGVVMLSVDVTASCDDDVIIEELTVLHEGFGDDAQIDGVYAAVDGGRVTRKRTIDSQDQTADLRFSSPWTIDACETQTLDIVADISSSATASSEHNFAVELPSDVQSNAKDVEGNFPLRGNTFRVAAVATGTVDLTYRTITPNTVEIGKKDAVIGKFEISADSTEDQTVYAITLEQNGSMSDGDIENIKIRRTDKTVLTNVAATTVGDYVTLTFDPPFTILEGDSVTLEVVGDVVGGAGDTVQLQLEEPSDLFAVGSLYGYGVNGQLYGSQVDITNDGSATPVTVDAGQFTIEIDGPAQRKYTSDDDDAVLANILMSAGDEDIDVQEMYVAIQGETSTGAGLAIGGTDADQISEVLEDVELRNVKTGRTISAVRLTTTGTFQTDNEDGADPGEGTFQIYRFDDFLVKGAETWELRVDFIENDTDHPKSGDQFRVHVCSAPVNTDVSTVGCDFGDLITEVETYNLLAEGVTTGEQISDVRPGSDVTGNKHRIAAPELNVAVRSIGDSETAVRNSKNINLFRFEMTAGEAEDILLTSTVFESNSGSLVNGQNYTLWVDTDGDSAVDTVLEKGVAAGGSSQNTVTFDELAGGGFVIPAEETVMFEVHADIAASLTGDDLAIEFADTYAASSYIAAEEVDDGSSLSITDDMNISTATPKNFVLAGQGNLYVSKDSAPVRSRQLLGGALGDSVLRLQFRAQYEDIDVTDVQINSSGSTATSVDRLELYKDAATTPFATATLGACGSDDVLTTNNGAAGGTTAFCANLENGQLIVPDGQTVDVVVRPRMKTDDVGATRGEDIAFWLTGQAVSNNATGSGAIRARGAESSNNLVANDSSAAATGEVFIGTDSIAANASIVGNKNEVVLAKITSITNANPASDGANLPAGIQPVGQFKFTAATNNNTSNGVNKATLSGVIFNVTTSNVDLAGDSFKFYNKADAGTKVDCADATTSSSGSITVSCPALIASAVDTQLDSGESSTFVLEVNIEDANTGSNQSSLQVSLQDFSDIGNTDYGSAASHLAWVDDDAGTDVEFHWIESDNTVIQSTSYRG